MFSQFSLGVTRMPQQESRARRDRIPWSSRSVEFSELLRCVIARQCGDALTSRGCLPAIPHRPDGRPGPARTETAAVIASTVKSGMAEVIMVAVIKPVAWGIVRSAASRSLQTIIRNAVVGRLMIAGQETVAVPVCGAPLVSGRGDNDGWQQRQKDYGRGTEDARHWHSIGAPPLKCDCVVASQGEKRVAALSEYVDTFTGARTAEGEDPDCSIVRRCAP